MLFQENQKKEIYFNIFWDFMHFNFLDIVSSLDSIGEEVEYAIKKSTYLINCTVFLVVMQEIYNLTDSCCNCVIAYITANAVEAVC